MQSGLTGGKSSPVDKNNSNAELIYCITYTVSKKKADILVDILAFWYIPFLCK